MIGPFRYKDFHQIDEKISNYGFNKQVIDNLKYYLNNHKKVSQTQGHNPTNTNQTPKQCK